MKDDERKKIKEPYDPRETPKPPQNVHPADSGKDAKRDAKDAKRDAPANEGDAPTNQSSERGDKGVSGHLLSEDANIDDETTI